MNTHRHSYLRNAAFGLLIAAIVGPGIGHKAFAQSAVQDPASRPLESLKGKKPPLPDLSSVVSNLSWARAAGKALFWDQQVGSDTVACASCHFRAGADPRIVNQLNPGIKAGDSKFGSSSGSGLMASGHAAGPNITLVPKDFPFHQLSDPTNAGSSVKFDSNDVASSMGTFAGDFVGTKERAKQRPRATNTDKCKTTVDPIFNVAGHGVRKVEPRNSPTAINAIFNYRNFWDGRANNIFDGVGVFGRREIQNDPGARLAVMKSDGSLALEALTLRDSSAASQADGPPLSDFEMSCTARIFADLGRKLLPQKALKLQQVDVKDSLFGSGGPLGDVVAASRIGLKHTYETMIRKAFARKFWGAAGKFRITTEADGSARLVSDTTGYTQIELNFPLFFGVSIMLYEATLVSDDSPFDRGQLSDQQTAGRQIFEGKGKCIACHDGALFSKAARVAGEDFDTVERMLMKDGNVALYDHGFYNIGVRPTAEDVGVGGTDPWNIPLSFSKQWAVGPKVDRFEVNTCKFEVPFPGQDVANCGPDAVPPGVDLKSERLAVNGAFKTPILRNVAITPPYFHNGGQASLGQVVAFYNRGGDFNNPEKDPDVEPLELSQSEQDALVAFLKSLTDDRVRCSKAPFDHPELLIPDGHKPNVVKKDGRLADRLRVLKEVGAGGLPAAKCPNNAGDLFEIAKNINGLPLK